MTKPLHAGHAACVGVMAAQAAAHGVTGAGDLLEGDAGFGAAMSDDARWERATEALGSRYNITRMTQKNHGCCGHAFAAIDAIVELRRQGLDAADVHAIDVATYRVALDVAGIPAPRSAAEAKFSLPYVVAHALLHGSVRLDAFTDDRLASPELRALAGKVVLRADEALTAAFPAQRAARVTVTTAGGQKLEHFSPCRKGDPEAPLSDAEIDDKFDELAAPVLGPERARELRGMLWRLETLAVADLRLASA
jgi:2-methylcitrate dehydratase PrpD